MLSTYFAAATVRTILFIIRLRIIYNLSVVLLSRNTFSTGACRRENKNSGEKNKMARFFVTLRASSDRAESHFYGRLL